jgi:hypothetical protein
MALQRQIGNQAVLRLLARTTRTPAPPHIPLQRYPANILSTPFGRWLEETRSAEPSAHGVSGGVYILAGEPPVTRVVVKPLYADAGPKQAQFGDAVAASLGVSTAESRIVPKNDAEFGKIHLTVRDAEQRRKIAYINTDPSASDSVRLTLEYDFEQNDAIDPNSTAFKVMAAIPGPSFRELSEGRQSGAKQVVTSDHIARLVALLQTPTTGRQLGEMMVADALMGNVDRLNRDKQNLGNIMVGTEMGVLVAIDTFAKLEPVALPDANAIEQEFYLEEIAAPGQVENVVTALVKSIQDNLKDASHAADFDPAVAFTSALAQGLLNALKSHVREGVADSIERAYFNLLLVGPVRRRLEAQALTQYGVDVQDAPSYERLQANVAYVHRYAAAIRKGQHPDQAKQAARDMWVQAILSARMPVPAPGVGVADATAAGPVVVPPPLVAGRPGADRDGARARSSDSETPTSDLTGRNDRPGSVRAPALAMPRMRP